MKCPVASEDYCCYKKKEEKTLALEYNPLLNFLDFSSRFQDYTLRITREPFFLFPNAFLHYISIPLADM